MSFINQTRVDNRSTPKELEHQLTNSSSTLVFISPALLPVLENTPSFKTLSRDRIILLAEQGQAGYKAVKDLYCAKGQHHEPERFENGQEHETAVLCYSSGTVRVYFSFCPTLTLDPTDGFGKRRRDYASQPHVAHAGRATSLPTSRS